MMFFLVVIVLLLLAGRGTRRSYAPRPPIVLPNHPIDLGHGHPMPWDP